MRRYPVVHPLARWSLDGLNGALWIGTILLAILAIYILSPFGAMDRLAAHQRMLEEMRIESQTICEKFGMPEGTARHQECVLELQRIRDNEDRRTGGNEALL